MVASGPGRRKAYTSLTFRASTTALSKRLAETPALANLNNVTDVLVLGGGVPIKSGNDTIGAIGVSGAPAGEKDEACGQAGIDRIADRPYGLLQRGRVVAHPTQSVGREIGR